MERLDAALRPSTVANGLARCHDAVAQRHFANKLVGPELGQEFVFGDHPITVLDEVEQDVEHLWLKLAELASMAEFVELGVECVVAKDVAHWSFPQPPDRGTAMSDVGDDPSYHSVSVSQQKLQEISTVSPRHLQVFPLCRG
jgi:hypothetical protein